MSARLHLMSLQPNRVQNYDTKKWLTATHALWERFRAENLSVDEYRAQPHRRSFNDFASAILPPILEEINALYNTTSRSPQQIHSGIHVVNPPNHYQICVPSNRTITTAITQLLCILEVTSSDRFTRRSELQHQFRSTSDRTKLLKALIASLLLNIRSDFMTEFLGASLQRTNVVSLNEQPESIEMLSRGYFTSVYRATFAYANSKKQLAVKVMTKRRTTVIRWLNEVRVLNQLQTFKNPHIVELLSSGCTSENCVLVFPLAKGNMDELMRSRPPAPNVGSTAAWVVKQMQGLAKALQCLHTGDDKNKFCGRHGDINPGNILWFDDDARTLAIADFGCSEFHSFPWQPSIYKAFCEGTYLSSSDYRDRPYAAPESEISNPIGSDRRASDIWDMGCVFLEFLVWILEGAEGRRQLLQRLRSYVPGRRMSFWHLRVTPDELSFSIKPPIKERLERLSEVTKDNAMLRATVEILVYGGVLDPDPHRRPTAKQLVALLNGIGNETPKAQREPKKPAVWTRIWNYPIGFTSESRKPSEQYSCSPMIVLETPCDEAQDQMQSEQIVDERRISHCHERVGDLDRSCEPNADMKRKCPYCKVMGRLIALKIHARNEHRNRHFCECTKCGELFADRKQLMRHLLRPVRPNQREFDAKVSTYGEQQLSRGRSRSDNRARLWEPHVPDENSTSISNAVETKYPTQMKSGGMECDYHTKLFTIV